MKKNLHIFVLLAILIGSCVIVSPISANSIVTTGYFPTAEKEIELDKVQNFTFTANSTYAIASVQFKAPKYTEINYTITYGAGNSIDGYISYEAGAIDFFGYGEGVTTINIGSSTDSRRYVDTGLLPKWEIVGYAREQDDNGTVLSNGYAITDVSLGVGLQSGFIAYQSVPSGEQQPIESISFTSNQPVWMYIGTGPREEIQTNISKTALETVNEWIQWAVQFAGTLKDFVVEFFGWLKFFFVDNLLLWMGLYIAITLALCSLTSKNIFDFYHKFFRYQTRMYKFIIEMWRVFAEIVGTVRGWFRI